MLIRGPTSQLGCPGSTIHKNPITYLKHVAFGQMKVFRVYSPGVNQRTLPFVFESKDTILKILKNKQIQADTQKCNDTT